MQKKQEIVGLETKVLKLKYYCGNCGRVAVSKSNVCVPRAIPQKKAKPKTKAKKK